MIDLIKKFNVDKHTDEYDAAKSCHCKWCYSSSRAQWYETFYSCNLLKFVISWSVRLLPAFQVQFNVSMKTQVGSSLAPKH